MTFVVGLTQFMTPRGHWLTTGTYRSTWPTKKQKLKKKLKNKKWKKNKKLNLKKQKIEKKIKKKLKK